MEYASQWKYTLFITQYTCVEGWGEGGSREGEEGEGEEGEGRRRGRERGRGRGREEREGVAGYLMAV